MCTHMRIHYVECTSAKSVHVNEDLTSAVIEVGFHVVQQS